MSSLQLPATATLAQTPELLQQLDAALAAATDGSMQIDASALQDFDTSAVALLLHAQRMAVAAGVVLSVTSAPAKLHQLARLYGVEPLLPLGASPN